jgi:hypothetical protein
MKKLNLTGNLLLALAITCSVTYGCNEQKPQDPSEGQENSQNEQGENYGAKGDDRPATSQPGESTTSNQNSTTGVTTDTTERH